MRETRENAAATAAERSGLPDKPPPGWTPSTEFKDFEGKLQNRHLAQFSGPRKEGGGGGGGPAAMEDASDEM